LSGAKLKQAGGNKMPKATLKKYDIFWGTGYVMMFTVMAVLTYIGILAVWNKNQPYIGGFIQFLIFATSGEILSTRILYGKWEVNKCTAYKAFIWGISGIFVAAAFFIVSNGVEIAMKEGMLPFYGNRLAQAFFTSSSVNLFFGSVHSAAIRIFGNYFEEKYLHNKRLTVYEAVTSVEWGEFVEFTFFRTLPLFWIPINTLVFLLPPNLQVSFAAMLSFAFGMLMALLKLRERKRIDALSIR